ncbi:MAG: type IX secretion system membrane protein PorP/SprF [Flavobacteriales bacterium]|nr:type IX secretion system membrane protein PorP/SprF [Flavobacteriales bacterium]
MKLKVYLTLFFGLMVVGVWAQQDPQFNQYFFNPLGINPAYAGSRGTLSAVAIHRSQWVGFEGAPSTESFSIHSPTRSKKMGLGLQILNDRIGPKNTVVVSGIYAYKLRLGRGKLAFGLRASLYNYAIHWDEVEYKDGSNFGSIERGKETYMTPSFDFGVYYNDKKSYIGLEITHLNEGKVGIETVDNENVIFASRQQSQVILTAGHAFVINRLITLKPSILVKTTSNQPAFIDLNASVLLRDKIWLGLSYRRGYGVVAIMEYNVTKALRVGYSLDISFTTLNRQNGGSHEIFIGYDLKLFKSGIISPRYF